MIAGPWQELRRRKVVQWSIAYTAGAWALLQGIGFVADAFGWPATTKQVATLVLLFGLPVVIVVAWYHGNRGPQRVTATEFAIVTLLLGLGAAVFWRYEHVSTESRPETSQAVAPQAAAMPHLPALDVRPSIAVLPFENRSDVQKDAYFVDGIHDDILTQLSKIRAMRVISRTSVEQFRDTRLSSREIGARLGVTKLLEGGVQRAGDRVRITVQLIDIQSDAHLWAENYDRELTAANIFAIQSEVAAAIAGALQAALTPEERARNEAAQTLNLAAWEAYQLGRQRMARRNSEALAQAATFFQTAIDRDPGFASAYAALAVTAILQIDYAGAPPDAGRARALQLAAKALDLDPNLAEAVTTEAGVDESKGDLARAEAGYLRAMALNPNYPTAPQWYSELLEKMGRKEEALRFAEQALRLDPLSPIVNLNVGAAREAVGRFDDALQGYRRAIEIDPSMAAAHWKIGMLEAFMYGRVDSGLLWCEKAAALDPGNPVLRLHLAILHLQLGGDHDQEARRLLEAARKDGSPLGDVGMVLLYMTLGDPTDAMPFASSVLRENPRDFVAIAALRDVDLPAGRVQAAHARYAQAFPEFIGDGPAKLDELNYSAAIDFVPVLQRLGEGDRARALLEDIERIIRDKQRLGLEGHGIADAQVFALRGQKALALAALRKAERAGWRMGWRYFRGDEPTLAAIRGEPEFKAVFADIERDMARQRAGLDGRPRGSSLPLEPTATR